MMKYFCAKGGGLREDKSLILKPSFSASTHFSVPSYIDSRPYCIESSNQLDTPSCAGQSVAGFIEVNRWKEEHVAQQVDGVAIYNEAKRLDGETEDGTTLTQAVKAAQNLGLLPKESDIQTVRTKLDFQFALHRYGVCICGFNITEDWKYSDNMNGYISVGNKAELGGHAVLGCYFDKYGMGWQNSWGIGWGVTGFGRMSWEQFEEQFMYGIIIKK